jgi:hypothetical protein
MHPARKVVARRRQAFVALEHGHRLRLLQQGQLGLVVPVDLREFAQRGLHLDGPRTGGPRGHERPAALLRRDEPLAVQQLDRLPHRHPRERELLDQLVE